MSDLIVRVEVYRCQVCPRTSVIELREGQHVENARCTRHEDVRSVLVGSWPVAAEGERKLIGWNSPLLRHGWKSP